MLTVCRFCKNKIESDGTSNYVACPRCKATMPLGAGYSNKKTKEVKQMTVEKKYNDTLKAEIIALANSGMSYKDISKKYNGKPNPAAISRWVKKSKVTN